MIQVTFMGTGAAFTTRRRSNVAMLVQEDNTKLLIECGPTILYQLDEAGSAANQIRYLFISHRHGDHILGVPMFLLTRSSGSASESLTILGGEDVVQVGKDLMEMVYPELVSRQTGLSWVGLPEDRSTSVELEPSIKLSTLPTPHSRRISMLALRLDFQASGRSLVYSGDTAFNERMADFASGCDLLVHEANFSEVLEPGIKADSHGGHSTARQAGHTASRSNCRILALVHLSPEYAGREDDVRADAAQEFNGQIIIPNDGATIYL